MTVPRCVYNYVELRNVAPPPSSPGPPGLPEISPCAYLFVAGFPSVAGFPQPTGSNMEGFFQWHPESSEDDNGGTVIQPASIQPADKGRWHRVFEGAISVKWFGA